MTRKSLIRKSLTRRTLAKTLLAALAGLGTVPALAAGGPVHLHLSAERRTETRDAQGRAQTVWVALDAAKSAVHPGDVLRYDVRAENSGAVPVSGLAVTQPVPAGTAYVAHSAETGTVPVLYSLDGHQFSAQPTQTVTDPSGVTRTRLASPNAYAALRWRFPALPARTSEDVTYLVKVR